jgi:hypothetical protein
MMCYQGLKGGMIGCGHGMLLIFHNHAGGASRLIAKSIQIRFSGMVVFFTSGRFAGQS